MTGFLADRDDPRRIGEAIADLRAQVAQLKRRNGVAVVADDGETSSPAESGTPAHDRFPTGSGTLGGPTASVTLTHTPVTDSLHLEMNGNILDEGSDYTLSGNIVAFTTTDAGNTPTSGDYLNARYDHNGGPADTSLVYPSLYAILQTATGLGNGTTTATFDDTTTAGSLLIASFGGRWHTGITFPAGWTQVGGLTRADADYEDSVWIYPDAPATTSVTVTDDFTNDSQLTLAEITGFGPGVTAAEVGELVTPFADGATLTSDTAAPDPGLAILGWSSRYYSGYDAATFTPADVSEMRSMLLYRTLMVGETVSTDIITGGGSNASGGVAIKMVYLYDT